ncbi:hypothetical protein ABZP36_009130 [Zizania latifolia]
MCCLLLVSVHTNSPWYAWMAMRAGWWSQVEPELMVTSDKAMALVGMFAATGKVVAGIDDHDQGHLLLAATPRRGS